MCRPPPASDDDRTVKQRRRIAFLDTGVEGIAVDVGDDNSVSSGWATSRGDPQAQQRQPVGGASSS